MIIMLSLALIGFLFVLHQYMQMRIDNHYSYPIYGLASIILGILVVILLSMYYNRLVENTIECYKLGGCKETNINKEIIISYERDLKEKEMYTKLPR